MNVTTVPNTDTNLKQSRRSLPRTSRLTARDPIQSAAKKILLELFDPIAGFVVDTGLGVKDIQAIFRMAIVLSVSKRQRQSTNRINISGIAATTGIPRAEIARILKAPVGIERHRERRGNQATNQILHAWYNDPAFTTVNAAPADLPIYGRGRSFAALVKRNGRGIPPRAMLDELVRAGVVELLPSQKVRAKSSVAVNRGVSARAIRSFGGAAGEMLASILSNVQTPAASNFLASAEGVAIRKIELPLYRKEVATKGADFLAGLRDSLFYSPEESAISEARGAYRVSVTVLYNEAPLAPTAPKRHAGTRRNFRRLP